MKWILKFLNLYRNLKIFGFTFGLFFFLPIIVHASGAIEIHFIDVGHGEATLIKTTGKKNILIDTGSLANGYKLKNYLKNQAIQRLSALIITHMHFDHVGGLFSLLPDISVDKIYDNGIPISGNDFWEEYLQLIHNVNLSRATVKYGDKFVYNGLILQVLSPSEPLFGDLNSDSVALRLKYDKISFFLAGDLSARAEKRLIGKKINLGSQILKVGHHGACDATSEDFLSRVSPEIAIISAGQKNRFGYPCSETTSRIERGGISLLRTDINGTVVIKTDGQKYKLTFNGLQ